MLVEHKAVPVGDIAVVDDQKGIVEAIVSVTGVEDQVKDIIKPGAYKDTLNARTPKGVWSHDWNTPVSRTLEVRELMPGDADLPKTTRDGKAWPAEAGGLKVRTQFNLETTRGREAYSDVKFFGDSAEWSIGYKVPPGGAVKDAKTGIRTINRLNLFEYSPVLFGAMPHAVTTSVKTAQEALMERKSAGEVVGVVEGEEPEWWAAEEGKTWSEAARVESAAVRAAKARLQIRAGTHRGVAGHTISGQDASGRHTRVFQPGERAEAEKVKARIVAGKPAFESSEKDAEDGVETKAWSQAARLAAEEARRLKSRLHDMQHSDFQKHDDAAGGRITEYQTGFGMTGHEASIEVGRDGEHRATFKHKDGHTATHEWTGRKDPDHEAVVKMGMTHIRKLISEHTAEKSADDVQLETKELDEFRELKRAAQMITPEELVDLHEELLDDVKVWSAAARTASAVSRREHMLWILDKLGTAPGNGAVARHHVGLAKGALEEGKPDRVIHAHLSAAQEALHGDTQEHYVDAAARIGSLRRSIVGSRFDSGPLASASRTRVKDALEEMEVKASATRAKHRRLNVVTGGAHGALDDISSAARSTSLPDLARVHVARGHAALSNAAIAAHAKDPAGAAAHLRSAADEMDRAAQRLKTGHPAQKRAKGWSDRLRGRAHRLTVNGAAGSGTAAAPGGLALAGAKAAVDSLAAEIKVDGDAIYTGALMLGLSTLGHAISNEDQAGVKTAVEFVEAAYNYAPTDELKALVSQISALDVKAGDTREDTPGDVRATQRLKDYWEHGEGAAKIAWNTPGDWTRCVALLTPYLKDPEKAKGYCNLRHKAATGFYPGHAPGDKA